MGVHYHIDMDSRTARFHFDPDLEAFLPPSQRGAPFDCSFRGQQSLKHLAESAGVPHTEIGAVTVNDRPASLEVIVQDGDTVHIHALKEDPVANPRFALDCHLGRLASYLRLLGFDSLYRTDIDDETLSGLAAGGRILLTRDRRLLMRRSVPRGCCLRATDPEHQLHEVVRRYRLDTQLRPFSRCLRCNDLLAAVDKAEILDRLLPFTRLYFDEFQRCTGCGQVYWAGSHHARLVDLINSVSK